ncbi:hypothetical protein SDC9_58271 [bioreactor metagenome]|uniref:Uncharacterized protein n=1 Tax=bioreactor metagenome TaxID=1076179 RepID=A0A644X6Y2_9ZZZZ
MQGPAFHGNGIGSALALNVQRACIDIICQHWVTTINVSAVLRPDVAIRKGLGLAACVQCADKGSGGNRVAGINGIVINVCLGIPRVVGNLAFFARHHFGAYSLYVVDMGTVFIADSACVGAVIIRIEKDSGRCVILARKTADICS